MLPWLFFPFVSLQSIRGEISGGVDASPNSFPFMLRLRIQGARGREGTCAGSLIHEKFFISALHCFISEQSNFWTPLSDTFIFHSIRYRYDIWFFLFDTMRYRYNILASEMTFFFRDLLLDNLF